MVASDVLSRGIDYERVNLVFNYDMAPTSNTYLHRVSLFHFCLNKTSYSELTNVL